jgi:hypothetical protein
MKPRAAKKQFLQILKDAGLKTASLEPARGIELMMDFYRNERAEGCEIEEDGDMLLFQWGEYDESVFDIDITRQFIDEKAEDENIRQLSLTFQFKLTEPLQKLAEGNRWCHSPKELAEFRTFILASQAFCFASVESGRMPRSG